MFDLFTKNALVPLVLRLGVAVIFLYHGKDLVFGDGNEMGAAWMKGETPQPREVQMAVAWGELLGGFALALGALTRFAATGLIAIMGGAIALVHWHNGFDIRKGGFEYNYLIIVVCLALMLGGGGTLAIDGMFKRKKKSAGPTAT